MAGIATLHRGPLIIVLSTIWTIGHVLDTGIP